MNLAATLLKAWIRTLRSYDELIDLLPNLNERLSYVRAVLRYHFGARRSRIPAIRLLRPVLGWFGDVPRAD